MFACFVDLVDYIKSGNRLVIAEGVLFEFVRRGQIRAGSLVPEVVIDNPEAVRAVHQEFCDAGSDVVQAFTVSIYNEYLHVLLFSLVFDFL